MVPDPNNRSLLIRELSKLKKMPPWGRPQGDRWDKLSRFIYDTFTLREIWDQVNEVAIKHRLDITSFGAYSVRRWYNHHTHDLILQIFYDHPTVKPEADQKNLSTDFYVRDLPFDLKISRFPKAYDRTIDAAQKKPSHLATWLYKHQSKEGRYHTSNRLFIILHDKTQPSLSWQCRREFDLLTRQIQGFLDAPCLFGLTLSHAKTQRLSYPWAALIFHVK